MKLKNIRKMFCLIKVIRDSNTKNQCVKLLNIYVKFDDLINLIEKSIHDPVRPGILKRQVKGKMTCSKARSLKSKQKNKGNNTAKAAQRYLNYHCQ